MSTENPTSSPSGQTGTMRLSAEPINGAAFFQSMLVLGALGVVAYKVLDVALRLL